MTQRSIQTTDADFVEEPASDRSSDNVSPIDSDNNNNFSTSNRSDSTLSLGTKMLHRWYHFAQCHRKTYATIFTVLSAFSFSTSFMFTKLCISLTGADVATIRVSVMTVLLGSYCLFKEYNVFRYNRRTAILLTFRTMSSVFGSLGAFTASQLIPLPDHTAIQYLTIAFTVIFARIFLKEPFSLVFIFAIACSLLGVVMVSKPDLFTGNLTEPILTIFSTSPTTTTSISSILPARVVNSTLHSLQEEPQPSSTLLTTIGILTSVLSAFCQSITYIVVRKMIRGSDRLRNVEIIYIFSLFSIPPLMISSIIWRAIKNVTEITTALDILYGILSGVIGMLAQLCMNMALKQYDASYISLVRGCDIIFSFIYQATLFDLEGNFITYIGIALMALSMFIVNIYKIWKKKHLRKKKEQGSNDTKLAKEEKVVIP